MSVTQGNLNNTAADATPSAQAAATAAKPRKVAWLLGALAVGLYLGSIAWFFLSRGVGA